jgi:aminoglycoside phosphotransferase family enzyme/predicted kinase
MMNDQPLHIEAAEDQSAILRALCSSPFHNLTRPIERIETHAAHVCLAGDRAIKMKKAIKLPYLDFSTLEKRKAALERELEVNRQTAPEIYLAVTPITQQHDGKLALGGRGKIVEWALVMRRFDDSHLLSHVATRGELDAGLQHRLAAAVARSHEEAPIAKAVDGAAVMTKLARQLARTFAGAPHIFPRDRVIDFNRLYVERLAAAEPLLVARAKAGLVRRCHGDLHAGNIVVIDGEPTLFDAIEFSEEIATIDVLYDLTFLLMDLVHLKCREAANAVLNRYLHLRRSEEDLSGLALLPLFIATRAGVRAIVATDRAAELEGERARKAETEARSYFEMARGLLSPPAPRLIAIGGLSGTGKSTLARALAPIFGASPGALHTRSDVERKVLAGVDEQIRLEARSYTPQSAAKVYAALADRARRALAAGHAVVVDAVFAREEERRAIEAMAKKMGVGFRGLWLEADATTLKNRVEGRRNDASDATAEVVERQLLYDPGHLRWLRVDATGTPADTLERARERLFA